MERQENEREAVSGGSTGDATPPEGGVVASDKATPLPRRRQRGCYAKSTEPQKAFTVEQRLLILDSWLKSGLPAKDFAPLVGVQRTTLYHWKQAFEKYGPEGLSGGKRGSPRGSRLSEPTKRAILLMKESHPEWGCERISDMLVRSQGLSASAGAVANLLQESGYEYEETPTRPHPDRERRFERARPNQLWQTDIFTFMLKRQNVRVYLVAFMDDHSRFITGYGLHGSASGALVIEVLRQAMASYRIPEEVLTDNGTQYVTWRGKSRFSKECDKRGVKQVVASPRHPQTLGKIERFWGSLWRECVDRAVFRDLGDARARIGHFIDYYNFKRPHQGLGGLVPADRYFDAAPEVAKALAARVAGNALELAQNGDRPAPFYMTGQAGGKSFSVHAEGEQLIMIDAAGERKVVDFVNPGSPEEVRIVMEAREKMAQAKMPSPVAAQGIMPDGPIEEGCYGETGPGESALDEELESMRKALATDEGEEADREGE